MNDNLTVLDEVKELSTDGIKEYMISRAKKIVENTQGDEWDDPEEWQTEAVELAHAVWQYMAEKGERVDVYALEEKLKRRPGSLVDSRRMEEICMILDHGKPSGVHDPKQCGLELLAELKRAYEEIDAANQRASQFQGIVNSVGDAKDVKTLTDKVHSLESRIARVKDAAQMDDDEWENCYR